jgi:lipopolysaccharide transport system ATP-binding protein
LIDEVLAVGDAAFQKRCLGKMGEVAREGRTVLFVSHNMAAVGNLCGTGIFIDEGSILSIGVTNNVIQSYMESIRTQGTKIKSDIGTYDLTSAPRGGSITQATRPILKNFIITDANGTPRDLVACGEKILFKVNYEHDEPIQSPKVGILFSNDRNGRLAFVQTLIQHGPIDQIPALGQVVCEIPRLPLAPGNYTISIGMSSHKQQLDWIEDRIDLSVEAGDYYRTGNLPSSMYSPFLIDATWNVVGSDKLQ